jgi:hypothetical protein
MPKMRHGKGKALAHGPMYFHKSRIVNQESDE